ncbi:pirin family protein, partial [bacterium]|nr:pirin family protein [bacterium]
SLLIHQDARIYLGNLDEGAVVEHVVESDRHVWLQVLRGTVDVNGESLQTSDGVAISDEAAVSITGTSAAEIMLFDLA